MLLFWTFFCGVRPPTTPGAPPALGTAEQFPYCSPRVRARAREREDLAALSARIDASTAASLAPVSVAYSLSETGRVRPGRKGTTLRRGERVASVCGTRSRSTPVFRLGVGTARRQRARHTPDQFCDISGLLVELSEPCDSTHLLRIRFLLP